MPTLLPGWDSVGSPPVVAADSGQVTLPAGSQLGKTFLDDQVVVHLVSRPFFGVKSADWSSLEVGPAGVAFVRDVAGGGVVLLGDKALPLSNAIPLGADGRSVQSLDLVLDFDRTRKMMTVVLDGATYSLAATGGGAKLEVAINAGSAEAWSLDTFEAGSGPGSGANALLAGSVQVTSVAANQQAGSPQNPVADRAADLRKAWTKARNLANGDDLDGAEKILTDSNSSTGDSGRWHLEAAQELTRLALALAAAGKSATASRAASDALRETAAVLLKSGGHLGLEANAWELAGILQERFFGDFAAARVNFEKAAVLTPDQSYLKDKVRRLPPDAGGRKDDSDRGGS